MNKLKFINCPICNSLKFEKLFISRTERIPLLKTQISICKNCGHIMCNPWPNKQVYKKINEIWYKFKFQNDPISSSDKIKFKRWEEMWFRINGFLKNKKYNILDIGSGNGASIEFLKKKIPRLNAYVIEQYKGNWKFLKEKLGCIVYNIDIEKSNWGDDINKKFDLVIFRHTLEHIKTVNNNLTQISKLLSPDGLAYIVVPDVMWIKQNHVKTSFFRPVHLHYFDKNNFEVLCKKNKLNPLLLDLDDKNKKNKEIFGIFNKSFSEYSPKILGNYKIQKTYINQMIKKNFWTDLFIIFKIQIKLLINWKNSRKKL